MPNNVSKPVMTGYGKQGPDIQWPGKAKVAINFVINYEEGAELNPVNQDKVAETYGGEFPLTDKEDMRHLGMESLFEYRSRAGIWRLIRLFEATKIPITIFITGYALTLNQEFCDYLKESTHEIAGHGWRWIDYATVSKDIEKDHIQRCMRN